MMKSDMLLLNFYPELQENCSKCGEFVFVIDRSGKKIHQDMYVWGGGGVIS